VLRIGTIDVHLNGAVRQARREERWNGQNSELLRVNRFEPLSAWHCAKRSFALALIVSCQLYEPPAHLLCARKIKSTKTCRATRPAKASKFRQNPARPSILPPAYHRLTFPEGVFGVAHATGGNGVQSARSRNSFAMATGGGLVVAASRHLSLRLGEVHYLLTDFREVPGVDRKVQDSVFRPGFNSGSD
jgi:hypothetical protein